MKTKIRNNCLHPKSRQRGAALIILMLAIVLSLVTLITFRSERRGPELEAQRKTTLALAQAKEALLGRAASNVNSSNIPRPGILPCPDTHVRGDPNEGVADTMCPINAIGRLPWRTLGLPDLIDGANERLWYKLSGNFRNTNGVKVNTATTGTLSVGGGPMLAAIVFAPGASLGAQVRDNANYNNFLAYLEGYTNAGDTNFNSAPGSPINDWLITILPNEIKNMIVPLVAEDVRISLDGYSPPPAYPASFPEPVSAWVSTNGWLPLISYQQLTNATAQLDFSAGGCPTVYQYRWDVGLNRTVMTRNGKC